MVPSICARNAWQKLGNMPQEEAMQKYVGVLTSVSPTWHQSQEKVPIRPCPHFSRLLVLLSSFYEFLAICQTVHICFLSVRYGALMQKKDPSKEAAEELGETSSQSGAKKIGPGPVFSSLVMHEDSGEGGRYYLSMTFSCCGWHEWLGLFGAVLSTMLCVVCKFKM